jgi:hypothetical protein
VFFNEDCIFNTIRMLASLREAFSFQTPKEMMGDRGLYSIQGVDIGIREN